ncbi:MAG TPA: DUF5666 domain-containing protein [Verrucomicrobiae bacterium]|jgi:hypothetical protein|nr:DUF5666 domain-containing protein [Verrucomicrobiae bacterium]
MNIKMLWMIAFAVLACQPPVSAETLEGQVAAVNRAEGKFSVVVVSPEARRGHVVTLFVTPLTQYRRDAGSLEDLSAGDQVRVDIDDSGMRRGWAASSIEKTEKTTPGAVFTESMEGRLVKVQPPHQSVTVSRSNPQTRQEEVFEIGVTDFTQYKGSAGTFGDLREGDEVRIEANRDNEKGTWQAVSIDKR